MSTTPVVPPTPMFDPSGKLRLVPNSKLDWATKNGGQPAVKIIDPNGVTRYAPKNRVREYLSAGAKLAPVDVPTNTPGSPWRRFLSSAWEPIAGAVKGLVDVSPTPQEKQLGLTGWSDEAIRPFERLAEGQLNQMWEAQRLWEQGRYRESMGHQGMAAVPVIGPWLGSAEDEYFDKMAKGDVAGALGGFAGNVALAGAPEVVKRVVPPALRRGAETFSNTGPARTAALVEKTAAENEAATADAATKNEDLAAKRAEELRKYHEKTRSEPETSLESGRARTPEELASHKKAVTHGVATRLEPEIGEGLKATEKDINAKANEKYNALREVLKDDQAEPYQPVDEEGHALGEPVTITQHLHDVASEPLRGTETESAIVKSLGKRVENGELTLTYNDLQGYREEIGKKLRSGNLPSGEFSAYQALMPEIDKAMQQIADRHGLGKAQTEARAYYRQYAETFLDRDSPVRKAIDASDSLNRKPGDVVGSFRGKDAAVEALAKYNPELAKRINTARGYQEEARGIKTKPATAKPEPKMPPKTPPVEPKVKLLGPEDIRAAKLKGLQDRVNLIRRRGEWIATGAAGYRVLEEAMRGEIGSIPRLVAEGILAVTSVVGVAKFLELPRVRDFLTRATPRDIAQIPPAMRASFDPVVWAAQQEGIKVSPALLAAVSGAHKPLRHPVLSAKSPVQ